MNQEEIRTASFDELAIGFLRFLEKEISYRQSTLTNYRSHLYRLKLYMLTHGIDFYTPDFGIKYYEMYLVEHNIKIEGHKAILTFINRFNSFYSCEEYVLLRKKDIELLPEGSQDSKWKLYSFFCNRKETE